MLIKHITIALVGKNSNVNNPKTRHIIMNSKPSVILKVLAAIGLYFVRSTILSILRSNISFQAQPAALIINAEKKNSVL